MKMMYHGLLLPFTIFIIFVGCKRYEKYIRFVPYEVSGDSGQRAGSLHESLKDMHYKFFEVENFTMNEVLNELTSSSVDVCSKNRGISVVLYGESISDDLITFKAQNVSVLELLDRICERAGYYWSIQGCLIVSREVEDLRFKEKYYFESDDPFAPLE